LGKSSADVVDAALRLVTAIAQHTVDNADGVSVTLERHGRLMTVAASDDEILKMDHHQYETGQGPCLEAKAQGRWFYIESLDDERRWPQFVPLALKQGIHSILSSPLMTAGRAQGALNIYSHARHAFGTHEQELAGLFATQASDILTSAAANVTDEQVQQRWRGALDARQTIARAEGVIMARRDVGAESAAATLRQSARAARVTLTQHAADLIASIGNRTPSNIDASDE
jgi:GAF domain-containing protein